MDGVWLVELANLGDPTLVPQAVASALGVREQPGRPLLDTLAESLRPRRLLLVLDNCEHLVAACATLADELLRASPELASLATSREVLGIAGETGWRVPSLTLPTIDPSTSSGQAGRSTIDSPEPGTHRPACPEPAEGSIVHRLLESEAVRFFVARASAAVPAFTLAERNAPAVVQVCRRLEGIPLALELAAARVSRLSVDQLAQRLDDRFQLLTGVVGRPCHGSRHSGRWWTGATTCSRSRSGCCCVDCRCSRAAGRSRRQRRSAASPRVMGHG